MRPKSIIKTIILSTTAVATASTNIHTTSPRDALEVNDAPVWTIEHMVRVCNSEDSICVWDFAINVNKLGVEATACKLKVQQSSSWAESESVGQKDNSNHKGYNTEKNKNNTYIIPASRSPGGPTICRNNGGGGRFFTVTSGWSNHFGPGKGFTVLAIVEKKAGKERSKKEETKGSWIVWPSYTDMQLENGNVVVPDQRHVAQNV